MKYHNSWIEISKRNLIHNVKLHRRLLAKNVKLISVVKSNAYGHGIFLVSQVLDQMKEVDMLATVNLEEAILLRKKGIKKPILVLSYYGIGESQEEFTKQIKFAIRHDISLMTYDLKKIKLFNKIALSLKKKLKIHIKVETGMARIGVPCSEALTFIKEVKKIIGIDLVGLASHFATTEESNQYFARFQIKNFKELILKLEKNNIFIPIKHIAASAAITLSSKNHFDAVRLGVSMYGLWPSIENKKFVHKKYPNFQLKPVLSWKTKIFQIKILAPDTPVGYGCSYRTTTTVKMALIPVGYFEGLDRGFSNQGLVLIANKLCPIIGRVCMNITMIDVSKLKKVQVGDEVTLIGGSNKLIKADNLALKIDTINYELVSRLNSEIYRKLIK